MSFKKKNLTFTAAAHVGFQCETKYKIKELLERGNLPDVCKGFLAL